MAEEYLPPVMQVLLDENWGELKSFSDFSKRFRKIAPEISAQAEYGLEHYEYYGTNPNLSSGFVVTASGGLNPFSVRYVCSAPECRIKNAKEFAGTLGLYADVITIPDPLSWAFADNKKPKNKEIFWALKQMLVVRELYPLIEAGVIRFWSGGRGYCADCYKKVNSEIEESADELIDELDRHLHVELIDDVLALRMTGRLETPTNVTYKLRARDKKRLSSGASIHDIAKRIAADDIRSSLRETLIELNYSEKISSVLFSTCRRDLFALKRIDNDAPSISKLAVWEKARSIQLPWVSRLSVEQIVRLREEAADALPAFRGTFASHIASPSSTVSSVEEKIEALRESAFEVERELKSLKLPAEKRFRNIAGSLGISVSVYGFAAGFAAPAVALGGLISLLGLVHASARHDDQKASALKSKPGFVLMKAKEMSEHA